MASSLGCGGGRKRNPRSTLTALGGIWVLMKKEVLGTFPMFQLWEFAGMVVQSTMVGGVGGEGEMMLISAESVFSIQWAAGKKGPGVRCG